MSEDAPGVPDEEVIEDEEVELPSFGMDDDGAEGETEVEESVEDPEGEVTDEQTDPEPEPEPEPDKVNVEKKVEGLGYDVANLGKKLDALLERQSAEPEPDPEPDPLDGILSGDDESEYDDPRINTLAQEIKQTREELRAAKQEQQSAASQRDAYLNELRADADRARFARDNPEIADQYDNLIASAQKELAPFAEMDGWTTATWQTMSDRIWQETLNKAKPAESNEPPPPNDEPDKPLDGTKVTHGGGTKQTKPKSIDEELEEINFGF